MKRFPYSLALLFTAAVIFTGCSGSETKTTQTKDLSTIKPHYLKRTYTGDELPLNYEDFAAHIYMNAITKEQDGNLHLHILSDGDVVTYDIAHMQVYVDIDNDTSTGLTQGNDAYAIKGADFMIEDNHLFKSLSNTEWKWEYVAEITNHEKNPDSTNPTPYSKHLSVPLSLLDNRVARHMNVSAEPVDIDWEDTNNYVPVQNIPVTKRIAYHVDPNPIIYNGQEIGQHIGLFADISGNYKYGVSYRERYKKLMSPAKPAVAKIDIFKANETTPASSLQMPEGYKPVEMFTTETYLCLVSTYRGIYAENPTASVMTMIDITDKENPVRGKSVNISNADISNVKIAKVNNTLIVNYEDGTGNSITTKVDVSDVDNPSVIDQ